MIRPIVIGLAPNLETDDILLALNNIISGRIFIHHGWGTAKLTYWFKKNLKKDKVFLLNSGRSALFLALLSLNLKAEDEVIIQAFTCVAVPNSVLWAGAKPVFVDISRKNLGIDTSDLKNKISRYTKAIIIQHTFGLAADLPEIMKVAKKYNLVVIEDCAHCIDPELKDNGVIPDFSVYSFGRDKAVSSVFGGVLIVNNQKYLKKVQKLYKKITFPNIYWTLKQHLHSILMCIILPLYNFLNIGKFLLFIFQKISLLSVPVYPEEKYGRKPKDFPKKMPDSLAILALNQLKKLNKFNRIRKSYVYQYNRLFPQNNFETDKRPLLRYPLLVENREELFSEARKKGIILGNWYSQIVDPKGVKIPKIDYQHCSTAYYVAQYIINLPTYPTLSSKDFDKIMSLFKGKKFFYK